ncbi:MAG: hypothetical protein H7Z40_21355 [Phycisphaerae bacterium]|nr:hypothetical protein [Gemmatimonadaceae bacterium]
MQRTELAPKYGPTSSACAQHAAGRPKLKLDFLQELLAADPTSFAGADVALRAAGEWSGEIRKHARNTTALTISGRWTLLRNADGSPDQSCPSTPTLPNRKKLRRNFSVRSGWRASVRSPAELHMI